MFASDSGRVCCCSHHISLQALGVEHNQIGDVGAVAIAENLQYV
jgi:hypothetical protein